MFFFKKKKKIKSNETRSDPVFFNSFLGEAELVLIVASTLVIRNGIARHTLVHYATCITAGYTGDARNSGAVPASWRISVKRNTATAAYIKGVRNKVSCY